MALTDKEEALEFLAGMEGEGLEGMDASTASVAYLSMAQPRGTAVVAGEATAGHFINTGTGSDYGPEVRVVPVGFKVIWNERDSLGQTVGRYEPASIEVVEQPLPAGKRGYPKKINPATGNEVVETYMYALLFPDYPEEGFALFIPTKSSLKACRKWNTMLRSARLPKGGQAPLFTYIWKLSTERVDEGKPTDHVRIGSVTRVSPINEHLYREVIEPVKQIELVPRMAIGAPEDDAAAAETAEY
jgi:hypothetical protein